MESPKAFSAPTPEGKEAKPSMNEAETLAFLHEHNVKLLEKFVPSKPLMYVHEDAYTRDEGPFGDLPPSKRPSIARINDPAFLNLANPKEGSTPERQVYDLLNNGGTVEHFAIDPTTKELMLVKTENKATLYQVRKEGLFEADDTLFPSTLSK